MALGQFPVPHGPLELCWFFIKCWSLFSLPLNLGGLVTVLTNYVQPKCTTSEAKSHERCCGCLAHSQDPPPTLKTSHHAVRVPRTHGEATHISILADSPMWGLSQSQVWEWTGHQKLHCSAFQISSRGPTLSWRQAAPAMPYANTWP